MEVLANFLIRFVVIFIFSFGSSSYGQTNYTGKYITSNYFDKFIEFTKQEFDNFIANEIPQGLSKIVTDKNNAGPTLSGLHRDVTGEGSHRRLSSSIRFKLQDKLESELTAHSCEVIIIERLPNGVFADPFELHHLVERGVFTDPAVFGDTNLELPSFHSNQSVVEIHMSLASKVSSRNEDDVEINVELPLHARYPPLGHVFSRVEFGQPDLLICCGFDRNVVNKSCLFMLVDQTVVNKDNDVIWDIPCGNKEHAGAVYTVTFGFAIVAVMLIVLTSICYSGSQGSDHLKRS
ncbi:hypothetical protein CASFOL_037022 [Castilleja foliolosa]|uniref:Phosphatidylinositol-glycan biosynthesis class X protein n=1 Tax=Castilleja foliolosa TaxID=1961234 RepID=A0ABD3BQC9_9LAMI